MEHKKGIFISYSHKDRIWLERLTTVLKPLTRDETIAIWDDRQIAPDTDWRAEIDRGLASARAAILLVSADFLASDFIYDIELKAMLERRAQGMGFFWIPLTYSLYERTPLVNIQAAWDPNRPLASLNKADQTEAFVIIARAVTCALDANVVAQTVAALDAVYPQLEAYSRSAEAVPDDRPRSLTAGQTGDSLTFKTRDGRVFQQITASDLAKLDLPSQQLIRAHERAMNELFDRWTELYPKRIAADGAVRDRARTELDKIKQDLCQELRSILDFLKRLGLYLDDHYAHIYQICT
jgi:hypothetical protein